MRATIPYTVKRFIDLTKLGGSRVVLSPYDLETLIIEGLNVQPKITIAHQTNFSEFVGGGEVCENPVYVSKDMIVCSAITGFSHLEHGVAVVRDVNGYKVITRDDVFVGESLVSEMVPGALIVAIHDGSNTHVVLVSHDDYMIYRNAYKKKPVKCSLGFRMATCVFSDERSLIINEGRAYEVGFPTEAVASTPKGPLLRSGEWLLYADKEDLRPLVKSRGSFAGFIHELPAFRDEIKLKILDAGALVDYVDVVGSVSAWNLVVDDVGNFLRIIDLRRKEVLKTPKDLSVTCWATKDGVMCCRELWCGLVDVGETTIDIEPTFKNIHKLRIHSSTLLRVRYGKDSFECSTGCEIPDEKASTLREHEFDLVLEHLLSTTEVKAVSTSPQVSVVVESAKLYLSEGTHVCGGPAYLELRVGELVKPERVKVYLGSAELRPHEELNTCLSSYNPELSLRVSDPVAGDEILLSLPNYKIVRVPRPEVLVETKNSESFSKVYVMVEPNAELLEKKICCSLKCQDLSEVVRECRLPAWIEIKTKKNNFIFNHVFEVRPTPKILECLEKSFVLRGELITCGDGGFLISYVSPDFPEIPPIHDLRIKILPKNTVIFFKSRTIGRALVVGGSEVRTLQLKPGELSINTSFSEKYLIMIDVGEYWSYEIRLSTEEILKIAAQHANILNRLLKN
ncbi:MAG: hypothetical protein QN229_05970 [Desulfurococcaceae archaeon TW002]